MPRVTDPVDGYTSPGGRDIDKDEKAATPLCTHLHAQETYFAAGSPCLSHSSWRIWGSSSS